MFVTNYVPYIRTTDINVFKVSIKRIALIRAKAYTMSVSDYALDEYVFEKYGLHLKEAALGLIARCKLQSNLKQEITAVFQLKRDDDLAELITYGNGLAKGCPILVDALQQYKRK